MPYIGNQPGTGVRNRFIYTATASQTTFSGADDNSKTLKYADSNYIDVYLNGVCLEPGTDYTASTKTSVVLTQAASLGDTLKVIAYDVASMDDSISKADGGTFEANVTFADGADIITASAGTDNVRLGENAGDSIASGGDENVVIGKDAGTAITTGDRNTAVGHQAGDAVTTGGRNTLIGYKSGSALIDPDRNVAFGYGSLESDTKGTKSTAIGYSALNTQNQTSSTDTHNTAVGYTAGESITTGTSNTLIGSRNGDALTTGVSNVAVGDEALGSETTANRSVAVGVGALLNQNVGSGSNAYNTAIGHAAGNQITSGIQNTLVGSLAGDALQACSDNVAVGYSALTTNVGGQNNVAVGPYSLQNYNNSSGNDYNTAVGSNAGRDTTVGVSNTYVGGHAGLYTSTNSYTTFIGKSAGFGTSGSALTGNFNTAVGYEAGYKLITSARTNTFLGTYAGYFNGSTSTANGITTGTNNTCLGFAAYPSSATVSDEITLGDGDVNNLRCNDTSISSLSDERDKTNIVDVPLGLDFINTLRPVSFDWNRRDGKRKGTKDFGFIAQELKTAQDATDYADHMRLVHTGTVLVPDAENTNPTEDEDGNPIRDVSGTTQECLEADPMKTYPVLVKAVQELSTALDAALARIAALEAE